MHIEARYIVAMSSIDFEWSMLHWKLQVQLTCERAATSRSATSQPIHGQGPVKKQKQKTNKITNREKLGQPYQRTLINLTWGLASPHN